MLDEARLDVAHVVTPAGTHGALARAVVERGIAVYVEKPFTTRVDEARTVLEVAASRGVPVCAGHQVLFENAARDAVASAELVAPITHVESYFSFRQVRRNLTPVEQVEDILPHAVYPIVEVLLAGSRPGDVRPLEIRALEVRSRGEVYAVVAGPAATGVVTVTLAGRPVEHRLRIVGENGAIEADFVSGAVVRLPGPGADAIAAILAPYRRAWQTATGATRGFARKIRNRKHAYEGLPVLVRAFYEAVRGTGPLPMSPASILETVRLCEHIGVELRRVENAHESDAEEALRAAQAALPSRDRGTVLLTGGTGFLGRTAAVEFRDAGWNVRIPARRIPRPSQRVAGCEYASCDLSQGIEAGMFEGVDAVVHAAAETAGGSEDQERNSVRATRLLVEAAAKAGVKRFVHVSSIAVLKPGREVGGVVDESTPVDRGNLGRGPYVWGKAESECEAVELGARLGVPVKVVRPGPLVDWRAFQPPGRLGREVGRRFVAIGGKRDPLSVCDVGTAAEVLRWYAEAFEQAPAFLNLVEPAAPTRLELLQRVLNARPDLKAFWVPGWLLRTVSPLLKLGQRLVLGSAKPIDVYAAFASERYDGRLAASVVARAREPRAVMSGATTGSATI
jgi:nucleoside-diphosphate-sugar epimerase/predicted dehydrogenase